MHVKRRGSQLQGAARDPSDVEQIVDQSRFQFDISLDHFQILAKRRRQRLVIRHRRDRHHHGGQRSSQLVAEGCEKVIFRAAPGLGLGASRTLGQQANALFFQFRGLDAVADRPLQHGGGHVQLAEKVTGAGFGRGQIDLSIVLAGQQNDRQPATVTARFSNQLHAVANAKTVVHQSHVVVLVDDA